MRVQVSIQRRQDKVQVQFIKELGRAVEAGLLAAGQVLLEEANKLVPKDTTTLMDSGNCHIEGSGLNAVAIVGYAPIDTERVTVYSPKEKKMVDRWPPEYAVIVHEDTELKHDSGEQAKFLEDPCLNKQDEIIAAFNKEITLAGY